MSLHYNASLILLHIHMLEPHFFVLNSQTRNCSQHIDLLFCFAFACQKKAFEVSGVLPIVVPPPFEGRLPFLIEFTHLVQCTVAACTFCPLPVGAIPVFFVSVFFHSVVRLKVEVRFFVSNGCLPQ